MKIKTSVSIEDTVLEKIESLAKEVDRSRSWVIERIIEVVIGSLPSNTTITDEVLRAAMAQARDSLHEILRDRRVSRSLRRPARRDDPPSSQELPPPPDKAQEG